MKKIIIILLLVLILAGLIVAYVAKNSDSTSSENIGGSKSISTSNNNDKKTENKTTLKSNSEIKSALTEQIEPHASYYLEEICVETNQYVEKGANILKYTNGTYLTAPYDCVVTELNLPDIEGKLLNSHYVEISSNNALAVTLNVDEAKINQVKVGQEATIKITTLEKEYTGYVTKVASTASNGRFKVTIEFENDGSVKLGMTASVELEILK
ncbi:MAG: HlyD family secretion protein [Clostridia bacterium]|nr:HlyD family secretion protein [Clostridia bacterium]